MRSPARMKAQARVTAGMRMLVIIASLLSPYHAETQPVNS